MSIKTGPSSLRTPLAVAQPPYERLWPVSSSQIKNADLRWGDIVIWWPQRSDNTERDVELLRNRKYGIEFIVVLPPPDKMQTIRSLISEVGVLDPIGVLPYMNVTAQTITSVMTSSMPSDVGASVSDYLSRRGVLLESRSREIARRILDASGAVRTVRAVARRLATSRRTLGRQFQVAALPTPSHWLQFGRLLRVATRLQTRRGTALRAAASLGYPDAFTMSNQMKRLIGVRPSEARTRLGWRWLVEAWIEREIMIGGIDTNRYPLQNPFDY